MRHAKLNFVRLQEAHDKKDLSMMRDFLAPAVYREIESDIAAAGAEPQKTEVLTLDAEVLDVAEEAVPTLSACVLRMMREAADRDAGPFSEIWHLEKPLRGGRGGSSPAYNRADRAYRWLVTGGCSSILNPET